MTRRLLVAWSLVSCYFHVYAFMVLVCGFGMQVPFKHARVIFLCEDVLICQFFTHPNPSPPLPPFKHLHPSAILT